MITMEEMEKCQECMKKNEELGMKVFDCEDECGDPENKDIRISSIRVPIRTIEEYYPINDNECWIKMDGSYGKYVIGADELDKRLKKYVKFI